MRRIDTLKSKFCMLLVSIALLCGITLSAFSTRGKVSQTELALKNEPIKIKGNGFYISDVADNRSNKKTIGQLVLADKNVPVAVDMQGGGLSSVEHYLKQNLPVHSNFKPVIINVKKLAVNEAALPNGAIDGKVDVSFSFELKTGEDMSVHLVNYNGSAHYIRTAAQTDVAEPSLRHAIENALVYFNGWMDKQADINPVLAKGVKLTFSDYHNEADEDTVYYSAKRPLTWADFKDRPRSAKYAAEIIPGLGFTEQTSIDKGVINVNVALKVYVPKSACWVTPGNMDDYTLNHEQRHFDIAKIISERYKKRMLTQQLPVLNYDGYINVEYFETLREADRLQKQYDSETAHGVNRGEQERWNRYIDTELAKSSN